MKSRVQRHYLVYAYPPLSCLRCRRGSCLDKTRRRSELTVWKSRSKAHQKYSSSTGTPRRQPLISTTINNVVTSLFCTSAMTTRSSLNPSYTHLDPAVPPAYLRRMIVSTLHRKGAEGAEAGVIAEMERLLERRKLDSRGDLLAQS